jgi:uncharacterized integral membrane protein
VAMNRRTGNHHDSRAKSEGAAEPGGGRGATPACRAAHALFAVVLLLLLIFILENGQRADISFFGAHGHLPLGVALLLAAVLGVLLVVIPGTGRIVQLRMVARRHRRIDATVRQAPVPAATAPAAAAVPADAAVPPAATEPPAPPAGTTRP